MRVAEYLTGALAWAAVVLALAVAPAAQGLTVRARDCEMAPMFSGGNLSSEGAVAACFEIAKAGTYTVTIKAYGNESEGEWTKMAVYVNGLPTERVTVGTGIFTPYTFTVDLSADVHVIGAYFLNPSGGLFKRRGLYLDTISVDPPAGAPEPALSTLAAWTKDGPARDQYVLDQTAAKIESIRKGDTTLVLTGADGKPLADTEVTVELTRHDFLFGGSFMSYRGLATEALNKAYEERFAELFNYATLPFYWYLYEPEKGKPDHAKTDAMVAWCEERGIAMKGHPLLWENKYGIPPWANGKQPDAATQKARIDDLMGRYKGRIQYWEVVNEPVNQPGLSLLQPHQWARAADPAAKLVVNEYGILYIGHYKFHELLQQAVADNVPFDVIGFQAHAPTTEAFPLGRVWRVCDMYAPLGKDLHITELCPGSNGTAATGATWRGKWNETSVAEYVDALYRTLFAHPSVQAITWWDFSDAPGMFVPNSGLLSIQMEPKPAFKALKKLIKEEWHTKISGKTTAEGTLAVRGFFGSYSVMTSDGKMGKFHLSKAPAAKTPVQIAP